MKQPLIAPTDSAGTAQLPGLDRPGSEQTGLRVLVVDDDDTNRDVLQKFLESAGHTIVAAADGAEALLLLEKTPVDAIISDILMPKVDGFRLCYEVRKSLRWRDLPFIFYTATYLSPADEELAFHLGADNYLRKPAARDVVLQTLNIAARKASHPQPAIKLAETDVLKEYSARLIAKLEEKNLELAQHSETLQRSEQRLDSFFGCAPMGLAIFDAELRFVRINDTLAKMNGIPAARHIGKTLGELLPGVAQIALPMLERVMRTGMPMHNVELSDETTGTTERRHWVATYFPIIGQARQVEGVGLMVMDISERKRAELAATLHRARFEFIFGSVPVGIAWMEQGKPSSRVVNLAHARLTGVPVEHCQRLDRYRQATHPEDAVRQDALHRRLLAGEIDHYTLLKRYMHPDRSIRWTELTVRHFTEPGSGKVQEISTIVDLTERMLADEALRRSEERLQQFIRHCPLNIAMFDREMRYVAVSETWVKMYAQGRESLIGLSHYDVVPNMPDRWKAAHRRCLAGAVERCEADPFERPGLGTRLIRWEIRPWYDRHNEIGGVMLVSEDITEQKQAELALRESEERFRQIAESISEVFWMYDPASKRVLYVSPAYEKIWGRTCESLYQKPTAWLELVHLDDRPRVTVAAHTGLPRGEFDEVYRIVQPDGSIRWIHDRAFPVFDAEGRIYRVAGTTEDITRERKLEEQFRQSQKLEAIGTLAGGIAHDFNNILAAINGYAEMARGVVKDNSKACAYLDTVLKATTRAMDLVRQILTFSRQQEQRRQPLQLQPMVTESLKLLRATIPSSVKFNIAFDLEVPTVFADPTQIQQVLMNLGTNAWHAMREGAGQLNVKLEQFMVDERLAQMQAGLRPGRYARLSVSDTGKGMDRKILERIFEPFFTTKAPGDGAGLGLAVVHGIMQSHDGAVTVYSQPGEGTTFRLYFPAYEGAVSDAASPVTHLPLGHGECVLYVDDEEVLVQLAKENLIKLGYMAEAHTDVLVALQAVAAHPQQYAVVITDQTMPNMLGTEFTRRLHEIRPDLPVIITTGYSANLTHERVLQLGAHALLSKPYTLQALAETVERALVAHARGDASNSKPVGG